MNSAGFHDSAGLGHTAGFSLAFWAEPLRLGRRVVLITRHTELVSMSDSILISPKNKQPLEMIVMP